jgi:group I intron endonuclease
MSLVKKIIVFINDEDNGDTLEERIEMAEIEFEGNDEALKAAIEQVKQSDDAPAGMGGSSSRRRRAESSGSDWGGSSESSSDSDSDSDFEPATAAHSDKASNSSNRSAASERRPKKKTASTCNPKERIHTRKEPAKLKPSAKKADDSSPLLKQQWGCIYRLTNKLNSKKYIGKSVEFKTRMGTHRRMADGCRYLNNAIRKYGWDNFKKEIIIDDVPEEDLSNLETSYIDVENTLAPNGYNLTKGGEGSSGYKHTDETRKKYFNGRYGTVCFEKKKKKWIARSSSPESKFIGYYFTKEKAEEALEHYNETGECLESDRTKRKYGTGSIRIWRKRYQARKRINGKPRTKMFDTEKECEKWLKST